MTSVALIGGDGAGKTSIAQHLISSGTFKAKYLYMGISLGSTSHLLPTSRFALWLKHLVYRRTPPAQVALRLPAHVDPYTDREFGSLWISLRYLNRFAEAWFRQMVSLLYQLRGYLVIYDRYFLYCEGILDPTGSSDPRMIPMFYRWAMRTFYPRPSLVILLDAPVDTLNRRKPEIPAERLDQELEMYRRQEALADTGMIIVDASRSFEEVTWQVDSAVAAVLNRRDGPVDGRPRKPTSDRSPH